MRCTKHSFIIMVLAVVALRQAFWAQTIELVPVVAKTASRTIELPGEFQPYLSVSVHARVNGFVETMHVDRGSIVKTGDLLVELSAPEMQAQVAEAQSKVQIAEGERLQAESKLTALESTATSLKATLASAQATYDRLKTASQTPGAISGNELDIALRAVEAQRAGVESQQSSIQAQRATIEAIRSGKAAAEAALRAVQQMAAYLRVTAPFDGVVTDRLVHPGALVGPNLNTPLLVIQQLSKLRLIVSLPEENVGGIARGARVPFKVPAYAERMFSGTITRVSGALDPRTRSMAVELDVNNSDLSLAPGMYSTVTWPVRSSEKALFVPKTSVLTTTERTFVVRSKNGRAEWVNVQKGAADSDLIRITGPIQAGDLVVKRATDEMREGMQLKSGTN
jgi:multidrug efflux pump subunit AcrA (membrane-fusion protein)